MICVQWFYVFMCLGARSDRSAVLQLPVCVSSMHTNSTADGRVRVGNLPLFAHLTALLFSAVCDGLIIFKARDDLHCILDIH